MFTSNKWVYGPKIFALQRSRNDNSIQIVVYELLQVFVYVQGALNASMMDHLLTSRP
jgi:hypothetical protein